MKWIKFRLETKVGAEEFLIYQLMELGIDGIEIEDEVPLSKEETAEMFVDIPLEVKGEDRAYLSFYLEEGEDIPRWKKKIEEVLSEAGEFVDVGVGAIQLSETKDLDWINNWKEHFHQFYIDDILIVPSWEEVREEERAKFVISMDPGTAFGTGMHETTQLCIRQLRRYIKEGDKLLDVGCGSGILGLMALKFGAAYSTGIDLDSNAKEATKENMRKNRIEEASYQVLIGNLEEPSLASQMKYQTYDVVVSNILAEVLVDLSKTSVQYLKPGGLYITSGIIEGKEGLVETAMEEAGIFVLEVICQGEWKSVVGKKKE